MNHEYKLKSVNNNIDITAELENSGEPDVELIHEGKDIDLEFYGELRPKQKTIVETCCSSRGLKNFKN